MNAQQRRKLRRTADNLRATGGCGAQFYGQTTLYPDMSCWDGYLGDDDAGVYDPTEARIPCPHCKPAEYAAYVEDDDGAHPVQPYVPMRKAA